MTKKYTIKTFLLLGIFIFHIALLCSAEVSAQTALYQKKSKAQQELTMEDEKLLSNLTSIRYLLMSGEKLKALSKIKTLSEKLENKAENRHYDEIGLVLLRIEEGRHQQYLYFPVSYEELLDDGSHAHQSLTLFQDVKRESIIASFDIDIVSIQAALNQSFTAISKNNLEKADSYFQNLYSDMIDSASLEDDPIQKAKDQLKKISELLKQGKISDAMLRLNESEKLLKVHIKESPNAPYIDKLLKIMLGYDKIRTYSYGKSNVVSRVRDRIFNTVSGMRSKLKYIEIKLNL